MRSLPIHAVLLAAIVAAVARPAAAQETLTYIDLVKQMTDLERLAVLPRPGEKCGQCSSYDRASVYDAKTGKYVRWAANGDGSGIIRREGDQVVMAEMQGPGVLWRIWSAAAGKGHVKIYLDGQEKPAVDMPFHDYFDAQHAPFNYPSLSYTAAKGLNLYMPIPYQKSCKVVADQGWGKYYHFTYATLPAGTKLPSFTTERSKDELAALARVDDFFRNHFGEDPAGPRPGQLTVTKNIKLAAGQTAEIAALDGPRAITAIRVKPTLGDREDQMAALRQLVLRITWDGQPQPAVWCPLGDFFGTAPGENLYKSLPAGMTADGYYALWYMPFAKNARVELASEGPAAREVKFEIVHAPLARPIDQFARFHAKWHRDSIPVSEDRWPDWTIVRTQGRGRFCGALLHVWNPRGGWWGEGDEKFFVDAEKFPSTFGTGSEDYFGYAWGNPTLFAQAYHAQTVSKNNVGHVCDVRWHLVDNVPFQASFEGCIEKYDHPGPSVKYACTAYWYLAADGADPHEPVAVAERLGYYVSPAPEGAGYRIAGHPAGVVATQNMRGFKAGTWKQNRQLWWHSAKPGDKLEIILPVKEAGTYRMQVTLTKARDYGIVQLTLDGKKLGEPIDLFNFPEVILSKPIELGTHDLTAGDHKLGVEITGANPKAVKGYMFGLNEVLLERIGPVGNGLRAVP